MMMDHHCHHHNPPHHHHHHPRYYDGHNDGDDCFHPGDNDDGDDSLWEDFMKTRSLLGRQHLKSCNDDVGP